RISRAHPRGNNDPPAGATAAKPSAAVTWSAQYAAEGRCPCSVTRGSRSTCSTASATLAPRSRFMTSYASERLLRSEIARPRRRRHEPRRMAVGATFLDGLSALYVGPDPAAVDQAFIREVFADRRRRQAK